MIICCYSQDVGVYYDEENKSSYKDTNSRQSIVESSHYTSVSNNEDDVSLFALFIRNCLEWDVQDYKLVGIIRDKSEAEKHSKEIMFSKDSCSIEMNVNNVNRSVSQSEVINILIDYLIKELKSVSYNCDDIEFRTLYDLSEFWKAYIKKKFEENNITITRFAKKFNTISRRKTTKKVDERLYRTIKVSQNSVMDKQMEYYKEQMKTIINKPKVTQSGHSKLTIVCRITDSTYITLLSPADSINVTNFYFPFAKTDNSIINLDIYLLNEETKEYVFLGGIEAAAVRKQSFPPLIFVVNSNMVEGYQVVLFRVMNTTTFKTQDSLYGEWEGFKANPKQWNTNFEVSSVEETCVFSHIPIVRSVMYQKGKPILSGCIYDLGGNLCYEGIIRSDSDVTNNSCSIDLTSSPNSIFQCPGSDNQWKAVTRLSEDCSLAACVSKQGLYVGDVLNGKPHGKGLILNSHGERVYRGEMKNGLYDGEGILYEGDGSFFLPKNSYLQATFHEGVREDTVSVFLTDSDFRLFRGTIKDGCMKGNTYFCNCLMFTGILEDWVPIEGTLYYLNGYPKYKGRLVNGKPDGKGIGFFYNQSPGNRIKVIRANNDDDKPVEDGIVEYEGEYRHGERNGKGTLYSKTAHIPLYIGDFKNNVFHGDGRLCITPTIRIDTLTMQPRPSDDICSNWEVGNNIGNMLYYEGSFENGHPKKGRITFVDYSYSDVEWRDAESSLVGSRVYFRNTKKSHFSGTFYIRDWVILFHSTYIKHREENSNVVRCSFYDNKNHCIFPFVYEYDESDQRNQHYYKYDIKPKGDNWTWKYLNRVFADPNSEEVIKLKEGIMLLIMILCIVFKRAKA